MLFAVLVVLAVSANITAYSSPLEKDESLKIIEKKTDYKQNVGRPASIGQFPYQVSLQVDINTHICGGSIISNQWILTSASCVYNEHRKMHALVGTNNIKTGGIRYRIARIIIHHQFKSGLKQNDIALLQTSLRIAFKDSIRNVYLAYSMVDHEALNMTLSGWKMSSSNSLLPDYLQYITVYNIALQTCKKNLSNYFFNVNNICTVSMISEENFSEGGLLVYNNSQYGILTWTKSTTFVQLYIYTNVSAFRFWIYSKTGV